MFSFLKKQPSEATIQWLIECLSPDLRVAERLLSVLEIPHSPHAVFEAGILQLFQSSQAVAMGTRDERLRNQIQSKLCETFIEKFSDIAEQKGLSREEALRTTLQRYRMYKSILGDMTDDQFLAKLAEAAASALTGKPQDEIPLAVFGLVTWLGNTTLEIAKIVKSKL